jgi:hypothetical protein
VPYLIAGLLVLSGIILPIIQNLGRTASPQQTIRKSFARRFEMVWCIGLFIALLALLAWDALPQGYQAYRWAMHHWLGATGGAPVGLFERLRAVSTPISGVLALPLVAGLLKLLAKRTALAQKLVLILLGLAGPLFFLVAFFAFTDYFVVLPVPSSHACHCRIAELWLLFAVTALYGGLLVNINYTSPHRYYRRQLSRTYLRRSKAGAEETEHLDPQPLSQLNRRAANGQTKAPYHLINCALNIPACADPNLRGRGSDFFLFSKRYCGSPIVGYSATAEWEALDSQLDLGTAMSVSAAAAAPQMGAIGIAGVSYLLAVLNIRLNYWATIPHEAGHPNRLRALPSWRRWTAPGALCFFKELTGLMMNEKSGYLNLSDGGHVENLGLYELLRRRCKFIITLDGEADPKMSFGALMTLVRLAGIDLGVTIEPDLKEAALDEKGEYAATHFLLFKIDYGHGARGFLLYVKSSMTGDESEFIQKYRVASPAFPHESTAEQLFSEAQFEAYRALGEHIAQQLFTPELVDPIQPGRAPLPHFPEVRAWFQGLANSLLEPEG